MLNLEVVYDSCLFCWQRASTLHLLWLRGFFFKFVWQDSFFNSIFRHDLITICLDQTLWTGPTQLVKESFMQAFTTTNNNNKPKNVLLNIFPNIQKKKLREAMTSILIEFQVCFLQLSKWNKFFPIRYHQLKPIWRTIDKSLRFLKSRSWKEN